MSIGNRIYLKRPLVRECFLDELSQLPVANIADSIGRLCTMHPRINLYSDFEGINVGRAITVKNRAGDNLMVHAALDMAQKGDVIVISNDTGESYRAIMGEIMFTIALKKELAGIIIDGPIRDLAAVKQMNMPIYATGVNPGGPYKDGNGEVNTPISCGGIVVNPGDLIVMDMDGIAVIPFKDVEETIKRAKKQRIIDENKLVDAREGNNKRQWVNEKLKAINVEIIDDMY